MEEDLNVIAAKAAARYARLVFWADIEELRQEAMVAALTATRPGGPYDPECGVPLSAYVWRACILHLRAWCWKQSAPVHAPHHKLAQLKGIHREEITETTSITHVDPFALLHEKRWVEDVQSQVDHVLDRLGPDSGLAARTIVLDEAPAHVAEDLDVAIEHVYRVTRVGRRLLADNALLYTLLKERST